MTILVELTLVSNPVAPRLVKVDGPQDTQEAVMFDASGEPVGIWVRAVKVTDDKYREIIDATWLRLPISVARHGEVYEYDWLPSRRPLYEVLAEIVMHSWQEPSHSTNCVCMDKYARELKHHVHRVIPELRMSDDQASWDDNLRARHRIAHVLGMVTRSI
jgi:hypothetical protein